MNEDERAAFAKAKDNAKRHNPKEWEKLNYLLDLARKNPDNVYQVAQQERPEMFLTEKHAQDAIDLVRLDPKISS